MDFFWNYQFGVGRHAASFRLVSVGTLITADVRLSSKVQSEARTGDITGIKIRTN